MECKDSKLLQAAIDFQNSPQDPEINDIKDFFIAGAQWMASQGVTVDGLVVCDKDTHYYKDIVMEIPDTLNVGDKVIIQIRKKEL